MRYTEFSFKNFKGIESLVLPLTGDVTTLIGLNESGKTTLLEAIFCFTYGAEKLDMIDPGLASLRDPERWVPISRRANFTDVIEIAARVELDEDDQKAFRRHMKTVWGLTVSKVPTSLRITERYTFEDSRLKKSSKIWDGLEIQGTKGQQRNSRPYPGSSDEWKAAVAYLKDQLPSIWYFPNFLFDLPERFDLTSEDSAAAVAAGSVRSEESERNQFYRLTFERVLSQIGGGANLETHVLKRLESGDRVDERSLAAVLLEMGREITRTVFAGWNRIFGRPATAQEVDIQARRDEETNASYLELRIKGPDGYFDLSERSLGFRWFFMFLLMTSYRGLSSERSGVVFLLDEPASNLHSKAQAELLKSFEALSETCQLVYTTHSHHLINLKWLDASYVVANAALGDLSLDDYLAASGNSTTSISAVPYRRFVNDNPDRTSYIQPVLDVLDYRPSSLELVPASVLAEGKSDFYLLRYFIDVLGATPDLPVTPGTGAGSLDTLISLHLGWGRSFCVLLDGDAEGVKQRARYEEAFGTALSGRCVLLPEVTSVEVIVIEDLLDPVDRDNLLRAVHGEDPPPYSKKRLNSAIMELYARREVTEISDVSKRRVNALLSALQGLLRDHSL
ncbi:MAG: hypothetical protein RL238_3295 [Actinomycetota bacterium]